MNPATSWDTFNSFWDSTYLDTKTIEILYYIFQFLLGFYVDSGDKVLVSSVRGFQFLLGFYLVKARAISPLGVTFNSFWDSTKSEG